MIKYYIPVGEDEDGLKLYKCIRGTSALEGLHQKIRQLVRGFANSPRLMHSMVSDFLLRWNQDIEVNIRMLNKKYEWFYDGEMIEDEIDKMSGWSNRKTTPHPEWISTKSVTSTGEVFGIIGSKIDQHTSTIQMGEMDEGNDADKNLEEEAQEAIYNLEEIES